MTNDDAAGRDTGDQDLQRDLRALGQLNAHDDLFRRDLRAHLVEQAGQLATAPPPQPERTPHMTNATTTLRRTHPLAPRGSARLRLASLATALLLTVSGLLGYLKWQAPTPVSAQTVLRHAAAAVRLPGPDQVAHMISMAHTVNAPGHHGGVSGLDDPDVRIEQWAQRDAHGTIIRQDETFTDPAGKLLQRTVDNGQVTMLYSARTRGMVVMTDTATSGPPPHQIIPDPFDPPSVRQFVLDAQAGTNREARLLPPQTIQGAAVYVVQVVHTVPGGAPSNDATRWTVTLYMDQATYAMRRIEVMNATIAKGANVVPGGSTSVQITLQETLPLSAVPAGVFTLHPPAGTQVIQQPAH